MDNTQAKTPQETPKETPQELKLKPKKSKKVFKIIIIVFAILAVLAGAAFAIWKFAVPHDARTDAEYLVEIGSWQKQDVPGLVWTFRADGTGTITTNAKLDVYDMTWELTENELSADHLVIKTAWLYELTDEFDLELDRKNMQFTVTSLEDQKTTTFEPYIIEETASE